MPPLSILDLAFVPEGGTPADALRNTLDLAQQGARRKTETLTTRRVPRYRISVII
jgi:hypothetical protein